MPDPIQEVRRQMHAFWENRVVAEKKEQVEKKQNKRGIELFNLLLEGIQEVYETAGVIAGGAVRDVVAGHKLHKDVDVFLPLDWNRFAERREELGWKAVAPVAVPAGYAKKGVVSRADAVVQYIPVDLIFQEKPFTPDDLKTFPIYAQRAMYTLDRGLFVTEECQKDVNNKTFTIDPTITNKDVVKNLRAKVRSWQERIPYADWKVIEPETQEWWEADKELKAEGDLAKGKYDVKLDPFADLMKGQKREQPLVIDPFPDWARIDPGAGLPRIRNN